METFTVWSPALSFDSTLMEAPSPQGEPHLRLETFTLCPQTMVYSSVCFPQVGISAPCTNSVYKAAHRSIRLATVSPPPRRRRIIANQPCFVFSSLFCPSPVFVNRQFCDFLVRGSPTPKPRQRIITQGFSCKVLGKKLYAKSFLYAVQKTASSGFVLGKKMYSVQKKCTQYKKKYSCTQKKGC